MAPLRLALSFDDVSAWVALKQRAIAYGAELNLAERSKEPSWVHLACIHKRKDTDAQYASVDKTPQFS